MKDYRKEFECIVSAARTLLSSGSEIQRVESSITTIAGHFGYREITPYVLSNGIFISAVNSQGQDFARVIHVPHIRNEFSVIVDMDDLLADMEEMDENSLCDRIEEIKTRKSYPSWLMVLSSGAGAGCFAGLLSSDIIQSSLAFVNGCLLWMLVIFLNRTHLSKNVVNLVGGAFVTVLSIIMMKLGMINDISHLITGSVIPLIPGVVLINAIQDLSNSDFISGTIRMLDGIIDIISIACGVGLVMHFFM